MLSVLLAFDKQAVQTWEFGDYSIDGSRIKTGFEDGNTLQCRAMDHRASVFLRLAMCNHFAHCT